MGEHHHKKYFVSAIGTDSGKSIVSAILCEKLKADYWKPIQAGVEPTTDSELIKSLISNKKTVIHKEAYKLKTPVSPHYAAEIDHKIIDLNKINLPETNNTLVIEGAGGLLVPINEKNFVYDLIPQLGAELILVVNFYLGSINHTLLTLEYLKNRKTKVKGLIFNGDYPFSSARIIENNSPWPVLGKIPNAGKLNKSFVKEAANLLEL